MPWLQNYDPLGNAGLSAAAAILPSVVLFGLLAARRAPAWQAALLACGAAAAVARGVFHLPAEMIGGAAAAGMVYGAVRLGWMLVATLFVYRISVESGQFAVLKQSVAAVSAHRGIQAVWIGLALGTLLEGAGGGGAVAVTSAILYGLGFPPLQAAAVALIGNSVSVAFGGMGNPIRALASSAGLSPAGAVAGIGCLLAPIALLLPFWIFPMARRRNFAAAWPVLLAFGAVFAAVLLAGGPIVGSTTLDLVAGAAMLAVPLLIRRSSAAGGPIRFGRIVRAWAPFALLVALIVAWSAQPVSRWLDSVSWRRPIPSLHLQAVSVPPIAATRHAEPALLEIPWLSTPGTAVFLAALLAMPLTGLSFDAGLRILRALLRELRPALIALALLGATSYVTRFAGMDGTIGVALSKSGADFPLVAGLIGWLGSVLGGTAAGSNATFGRLQASTAASLGFSPLLGASANAAGGAMGKMLSAPSLVIAAGAANLKDGESSLCRRTIRHSIMLLLFITIMVVLGAVISRHFGYSAPSQK